MDKNIIIEAREENNAAASDMTKIKNHFSLIKIGALVPISTPPSTV